MPTADPTLQNDAGLYYEPLPSAQLPIIGHKDNMDSKEVDLWHYIQNCDHHFSAQFVRNAVVDSEITHLQPTLQEGRTNRVLVYAGCFNPPHRGHEAILTYAFLNMPDAIAVIVLLVSDDDVRHKVCKDGNNPVFSQDQRIRLWQGRYGRDWCLFTKLSRRKWHSFQASLAHDIEENGFEVEFVFLQGPDHVQLKKPPVRRQHVVSDIGRPADFNPKGGPLLQLAGYGPWNVIPHDEQTVRFHAAKMVRFAIGEKSRGESPLNPTQREELKRGQ